MAISVNAIFKRARDNRAHRKKQLKMHNLLKAVQYSTSQVSPASMPTASAPCASPSKPEHAVFWPTPVLTVNSIAPEYCQRRPDNDVMMHRKSVAQYPAKLRYYRYFRSPCA